MPDTFDSTGLTTKTLTELRDELILALQAIYGEDINVDQNSPDGQIVNLFAQAGVDLREILKQINAGFDPDQASGRVLDQRVVINGIRRNFGTYTFQDVEITTDQALNLVGLDDQAAELTPTVSDLYTVKDDAGVEFYLLASIAIGAAGTQALSFRAAALGQVEVQLNTITTPVTIIAGVTDINNPSAPDSVGTNEERDAQLKDRRRSSVSIPALGFLDSLEASLNDLEGVTTAIVKENDTNATDSDGTEAHTIWAIVEGGADADIGQIIYVKKTAGCGMRGAETVDVPRPNGSTYEARFDRPVSQDLWIRFSLQLIGGGVIDEDNVKLQIVEGVIWDIGGDAASDDLIDFLKDINPNYRITGMEISDDDITYVEVVSPTSPQHRFVNDVARITIA